MLLQLSPITSSPWYTIQTNMRHYWGWNVKPTDSGCKGDRSVKSDAMEFSKMIGCSDVGSKAEYPLLYMYIKQANALCHPSSRSTKHIPLSLITFHNQGRQNVCSTSSQTTQPSRLPSHPLAVCRRPRLAAMSGHNEFRRRLVRYDGRM
jgi:hypothetical protein